jgi:integrase
LSAAAVRSKVVKYIPPPEIHSLDAEQAKTLLEAVRRERLEAVFVVAVSAGLLIGETLELRWTDVDVESR